MLFFGGKDRARSFICAVVGATVHCESLSLRSAASNPSGLTCCAASRRISPRSRALPDTMDGQPPLPVPQQCPVTLDELLTEP
jgi:hypothetical protein